MLDPQHHLTPIRFSKSEFQKAWHSTPFREFVNCLSEKKDNKSLFDSLFQINSGKNFQMKIFGVICLTR